MVVLLEMDFLSDRVGNFLTAVILFEVWLGFVGGCFFPQYFISKNFKHTPKLKELCSNHPYTHRLVSAINILLLCLFYHIPVTHLLIHLNLNGFQNKLQASGHFAKYFIVHIIH